MTELNPSGLTPMMAQYRELKRRYPDFLLLFRLGDFYELFFEDAEAGARLLSIALTSRQGAPMAGIRIGFSRIPRNARPNGEWINRRATRKIANRRTSE